MGTPCMMWLDKWLKYSIWAGSILHIFQPNYTLNALCVQWSPFLPPLSLLPHWLRPCSKSSKVSCCSHARICIRCYSVIPFCLVPFCPINTCPISSNILKNDFMICDCHSWSFNCTSKYFWLRESASDSLVSRPCPASRCLQYSKAGEGLVHFLTWVMSQVEKQ